MAPITTDKLYRLIIILVILNLNLTWVLTASGNSGNNELMNALLTRPGSVLIVKRKVPDVNVTGNNTMESRAIRFDGEMVCFIFIY